MWRYPFGSGGKRVTTPSWRPVARSPRTMSRMKSLRSGVVSVMARSYRRGTRRPRGLTAASLPRQLDERFDREHNGADARLRDRVARTCSGGRALRAGAPAEAPDARRVRAEDAEESR